MIEKKNTLKPLILIKTYRRSRDLPLATKVVAWSSITQATLSLSIGPCRFLYPLFKTSPKIPRFQSSLQHAYQENLRQRNRRFLSSLYPISISATGSAAQSYFLATYPCSIGGCQLTFGQLSSDPAQDGYYYALMVVRQEIPPLHSTLPPQRTP